ncbi:hypothetical protein ACHHYP_14541 [Achlya hypogyna]|uniref:Uncharacterized protein n=1 Tax=Achlya hypogyna TaxID=1202772 RepID=A0A1V9YD23_ACHHY|nr:hypothetical protein ACHHYP_14541 [Achlya hypogyna]
MGELQTCRYSHGKCKLPRATKKNGTLHTLCEYHRTKACAHQKKLDAKRRNEKLKLFQEDPSLRPGRKMLGKPLSPTWHDAVVESENRPPVPARSNSFGHWDHHQLSPPPLSPSFLKPLPAYNSHHYGYPASYPSPRQYEACYDTPTAPRYASGSTPKYSPAPLPSAYAVRPMPPVKADADYSYSRRDYPSYTPSPGGLYGDRSQDLLSTRYDYGGYDAHDAEPAYSRWGAQPVAYHS